MVRSNVLWVPALAGLLLCALPAGAQTCDNGLYSSDNPTQPPFWADVLQWTFRESTLVGLTRTAGVATPDGNIHVVCGNTMLAETSYSREQIYIPGADSWYVGSLTHPAAPGGVHNHDAKLLGNKIYVGGGSRISGFYDNLTMIDLEANTWTVVVAMPSSSVIYYEFAAGSDGRLYMFGGDGPYTSSYAFDTTTRTWSSRAAMPVALRDPAAACVGDTIYLFGGYTDAAGTTPTNAVRAYSITGNNWTSKTNMPTARGWATANVVNTTDSGPMIYVIGGTNGTSPIATVERYGVATGTWTSQTALQQFRRSHAGVTVGDSVFILCGWRAARPVPFLRAVERGYDPLLTGVEEPASGIRGQGSVMNVFPNPCSRCVSINAEGGVRSAECVGLYSAAGELVRQVKVGPATTVFSVADLKSGVYWLRADGQGQVAKLVVNN